MNDLGHSSHNYFSVFILCISDGGCKHNELTQKLLFMLAKDFMPFKTVEKEGFKLFLNCAAPFYKIPSRNIITKLMEEKYEVLSAITKKKFITYQIHISDSWYMDRYAKYAKLLRNDVSLCKWF